MENGKLKRSGKKVSTPFLCLHLVFIIHVYKIGYREKTKYET